MTRMADNARGAKAGPSRAAHSARPRWRTRLSIFDYDADRLHEALKARIHPVKSGPTSFDQISANLADESILITCAATATDRADDLSVFDKRISAGGRRQLRIERANIGMASFV